MPLQASYLYFRVESGGGHVTRSRSHMTHMTEDREVQEVVFISRFSFSSYFNLCEQSEGRVMYSGGFLLCLLCVFPLGARAQYDPDEVQQLPGMKFKPNYQQWSGYLDAGPGRFLHYW